MPDEIIEPYVSIATFCEHALEEKDGVLSAIRIVDRLFVDPTAIEGIPDDKPPLIPITLVLKFLSVGYSGKRNLKLVSLAPNGKEVELLGDTPIVFSADKTGLQVKVIVAIGLKHAGWYWIAVHLDNEVLIRLPLEIMLQKALSEQQTSR